MHLDGYKYWLAYKKGDKSYFRCSRSKSQKCPGKLIMKDSKVVNFIPHDHEKEDRNNAIEKFRNVLTKKAAEKPNKSLVDIYLEETINHSEASILYPFTQAESTMRKARSKILGENDKKCEGSGQKKEELAGLGQKNENSTEEGRKNVISIRDESKNSEMCGLTAYNKKNPESSHNMVDKNQEFTEIAFTPKEIEGKKFKNEEFSAKNHESSGNDRKKEEIYKQGISIKGQQHQKFFYVEDIYDNSKIILMNQMTLKILGKIEEIHIDCGMQIDVKCDQSCTRNEEQLLQPDADFLSANEVVQEIEELNTCAPSILMNSGSFSAEIFSPKNQQSTMTEIPLNDLYFHKQDELACNFIELETNICQLPQESNQIHQLEGFVVNLNENFEKSTFIQQNLTSFNTEPPELVPIAKGSKSISNCVAEQGTGTSSCPKIFTTHTNFGVKRTNRFHLITIIALIKGRDCPIAFGLLKSLNSDSILNFLQIFNQKIKINPSIILTSTDQILQHSIYSTWPEATIKIMYFYYAHSILKHLKKNLTKNILEISSLKMILSMPMIPTNYVVPGWEALRKWMSEKHVNLDVLCEDVYDKWLASNAEKISIFNGLTHSINNHTQVFQNDLINSFDGNLMTLDILTDKICRHATKCFVKFTKTSESLAKKIQKLQKTVKVATKNWISSPFHLRRPIQFLQQVSHCIDDGMINFVINFDGNYLEVIKETEPPPLIFNEYVKKPLEIRVEKSMETENFGTNTEPPPLVPIRRNL